jgi:hypothetical protein
LKEFEEINLIELELGTAIHTLVLAGVGKPPVLAPDAGAGTLAGLVVAGRVSIVFN